MEEQLPPACTFAISVLAEHKQDPEAVPEEAVEASLQHMASCPRCLAAANPTPTSSTTRKRKKTLSITESLNQANTSTWLDESTPPPKGRGGKPAQAKKEVQAQQTAQVAAPAAPAAAAVSTAVATAAATALIPGQSRTFDCQQCRQDLLPYAEALDKGLNVAELYPDIQAHLQVCEEGCVILLELCKQEAKTTRKDRRELVRNPFKIIGWEVTGFFRSGQIPVSPKALAFGTLILLILFASLSTYVGINIYETHYHPIQTLHLLPTPDGIGLSDGLKIYDACNTDSYNNKKQAALALQSTNSTPASNLLKSAINATLTDTTGCNGAEAAIYGADLQVRQSKRPFSMVVVSFDSTPGNANPQGGSDRKVLYAANTQELIGAFIAQQQYNTEQMQTAGAPLLYLVLANTIGSEQGALQIATTVTALAQAQDVQQFGLLAKGQHPLLGVLGLGPANLTQVALSTLCRAGIPLIAPTTTESSITHLLTQTSSFDHCAPGFAFVRFSPDDTQQSALAAAYTYDQLKILNAAIFYDPGNQSSQAAAQSFQSSLLSYRKTHVVAQEIVVGSGVLDAQGHPQDTQQDLLLGLANALKAQPQPELIYASLPTKDINTLIQDIARLPQKQQPILLVGGSFVQPRALRGVVQWVRQQQLALPQIFVAQATAARPPGPDNWQKQFYASFCTSFATTGSYCSGATTLDQGALLFADGIETITRAIGSITDPSKLPSRTDLVKQIRAGSFMGVSGPITLQTQNVMMTGTGFAPVVVAIQQDGSLQIVR